MKNSTTYAKKLRKLLTGLKKGTQPLSDDQAARPPLELLVLSALRENASLEDALKAMKSFSGEFVDFNELRVAPTKDVVELLPGGMIGPRERALAVTRGLHGLFDQGNRLDFEHVEGMGKRELRTHLRESMGLSSFSEAYLMLYLFDTHAVPTDARLAQRLRDEGLVDAGATDDEVRSLLQRVVTAKNGAVAFELLAAYAASPAKPETAKKAAKKTKAKAAKTKTAKTAEKTKAAKPASKTTKTAKAARKRKTTKTEES